MVAAKGNGQPTHPAVPEVLSKAPTHGEGGPACTLDSSWGSQGRAALTLKGASGQQGNVP